MNRLPRYIDDEVDVFHPFFEKSFKNIIINNKFFHDNYELIHHPTIIGGKIPDFIFRNKKTKKSALISEIKRTKSAVENFNFKEQVRGYADLLFRNGMERPYYLLTNLEISNFYKYKDNQSRTIHHLLDSSPIYIADFYNTAFHTFQELHEKSIKYILEVVFEEQKLDWKVGLSELDKILINNFRQEDNWTNILSRSLLYYLIGAFEGKGLIEKQEANTQSFFNSYNHINKLDCFTWLDLNYSSENNNVKLNKACYEAGKSYKNGSDFSSVIQGLVYDNASIEEKGSIVSTDAELCNLINFLAFQNLDINLDDNQIILDPSAGVGNILAEVNTFFRDVLQNQLWANDIDFHFQECLKLRLSLLDSKSINSKNFPKVTNRNIKDFTKNDLCNVKIIMQNPPFKRRANKGNVAEINLISNEIKKIKYGPSVLNVGQSGLECFHLEMLTSLAQQDTIIVTVFPTRYIYSLSIDSVALRKYLLSDFGLTMIVEYPHNDIFSDVKKTTLILCGVKNKKSEFIKFINLNINIESINFELFSELLNKDSVYSEITINNFPRKELYKNIDVGWRNFFYNKSFKSLISTLNVNLMKLENYKNIEILQRGNAGVKGSSDIIFFNPTKKNNRNNIFNKIPKNFIMLGVRSARDLPFFISKKTFTNRALNFSSNFNISNQNLIENCINDLLKLEKEGKVQYKEVKSISETIDNINSCRIYERDTFLIPRAVRRTGYISVLKESSVLSTNFLSFKAIKSSEVTLILSWFLSIFGQIQFEENSNNENGVRKIEHNGLANLLIPNFTEVPKEIVDKILKVFSNNEVLPYDFTNIKISKLDIIWSNFLFKDEAQQSLSSILEMLQKYIDIREP